MMEEGAATGGEEASEDFLLAQPSPGSGACVIIGRWARGMDLPGEEGCRVFWIVDPAGENPPPPGALTVQRVDEPDAGRFEEGLDDFLHRTPKALPSLYVTRFIPDERAAHYVAAIDAVAAALESHRRARATRQQDAFAWQSHLFENLADYAARRLPDAWEGALTGIPALICGAGPSLDVSISALARGAGDAVVFAADSSVRALAGHGVRADFIVSVDVTKTPAKCLPEGGAPGRVVLAATSPPDWAQAVPADRRFYVSSNQLTLDWLDSRGMGRTKTAVHENCGATALELARFLGCSPIYLFGMDLALDDTGRGRRHHGAVESSAYVESGFHAAQEFPRVPGNFSPTVPTHVVGDWRSLDRRLAQWPAGLVHVVTDRGARLRNTTLVRPEEFSLPPGARPSKETALAALPAGISPSAAVRTAVADALAGFGASLVGRTPSLRAALDVRGASAVVDSLRALFTVPEHDSMLGAYALKLLPHLLPPLEEEAIHWKTIIDVLAELGGHAAHAAMALRNQL